MINNISIITPRYPPTRAGGGEQSVQLLAEQLTKSDRIDDVTVFSFDGHEIDNSSNVTVRRLGNIPSTITELQNILAYRKIQEYLNHSDLIHSYNMELNPLVGYISSTYPIRSVATLNSYHFFKAQAVNRNPNKIERLYELVGHPTTGRILRHYQQQNDYFVAISNSIKQIYTNHGISEDKISVVPNMYDPTFEPPPLTQSSAPHSLLYVGELTKKKGIHVLIKAVKELPSKYQLRIVGTGPHEDDFRSLTEKLNITDQINFTGPIPYNQIGEAYGNASLFIHPGIIPEAFGRTIIEAMQSGLPVVCTNIGGPPDIVLDQELICEPEDPEALARAIQRAKFVDRNPEEYRQYVEKNFAPEIVINQMIDIYDNILN